MVDRLLLDALGYLDLPGAAGDKADTPDHTDFAIAGDIDIRVLVAMTDWTPATLQYFITQWSSSDRAWLFRVDATGTIAFAWSAGGAVLTATETSSVAPTVSNGAALWVRVTFDVDNGASGRDVKFYTSTDPVGTDPASVTWTQLGTTRTSAGVTSIFNSSLLPTIGADAANNGRLIGKGYYAEVRNGIGGTVVANPDFRDADQQDSATQLTDDFGKVWTVQGAAAWTLPGATDSYQLEDGSGILLLESSTADVARVPYVNPYPQLLAH